MRRGRRSLPNENNKVKYLLYISGISLIVVIISFTVTSIVYNNSLKKYSDEGLSSEYLSTLVPDLQQDSEETSKQTGKSINEVINELQEENLIDVEQEEVNNTSVVKEDNEIIETINNEVIEEVPDPNFIKPVEGDIMKEFAKDNLVYSNTLNEWIVHLGIDIKADRTTVVKASAPGKVTAIKNDPRYGLTVIIEHVNGYKTVYSNLLTTDFVNEGEEVGEGQSIGTVGNSAAFEIADEAHLHFEIIKNEEYLDPKIYIN